MTQGATSGWLLRSFGKVGLLIDDAPFARSRVARELYGADELPAWWVSVSTVQDGKRELLSLTEQLDKVEPGRCGALIVVDRALPLSRSSGPKYWEDPTGSIVPSDSWQPPSDRDEAALLSDFQALISNASERENVSIVFMTSYPRLETSQNSERKWMARFQQPLFQRRRDARRQIGGMSFAPFLRFLPESYAAIEASDASEPAPGDAASAHYLAGQAQEKILTPLLAAFASDRCLRVLVTGAGMSQSSGPEHPGMPRNEWLLARAAWETLREKNDEWIEARLPWREPSEQADKDWSALPPDPALTNDTSNVAKCIAEYLKTGKVTSEAGRFNDLFRDSPNDLERTFRRHLRASVLRHDEGITHRHWLAARLPFHIRFTTNFDGFHQRAAAYLAARAGREPGPVISVYGGAATESKLAFSDEDFKEAVRQVEKAMQAMRAEALEDRVVVVVGYAFRDPALPQALARVLGKNGTLFWVAPESHKVLERLRAGGDPHELGFPKAAWDAFKKLLNGKRKGAGRVVAVPARATDFFHDLWELFPDKGRLRAP